MKTKIFKTSLFLLLSFALVGCGNETTTSSSSEEESSSSEVTSYSNVNDDTYIESEGFPREIVDEFCLANGISVNIPTPTYTYPYWNYLRTYMEGYDTCIDLYVEDDGTVGVDSIEDSYKTILEDNHWSIDSSNYDSSGYIATYEGEDNCEIYFFTDEGVFVMTIYAPNTIYSE